MHRTKIAQGAQRGGEAPPATPETWGALPPRPPGRAHGPRAPGPPPPGPSAEGSVGGPEPWSLGPRPWSLGPGPWSLGPGPDAVWHPMAAYDNLGQRMAAHDTRLSAHENYLEPTRMSAQRNEIRKFSLTREGLCTCRSARQVSITVIAVPVVHLQQNYFHSSYAKPYRIKPISGHQPLTV